MTGTTSKSLVVVLALALTVAGAGCLSSPEPSPEETDTDADAADADGTADFTNTTDGAEATAVFTHEGEAVARLSLEVAETPEERSRGLMYRESLEDRRGMVFVYGEEERRSFWMKNTYIPLDMVFVGEDGRVNAVRHASPQPNASVSELRRYTGDAKYVIETNRGFANETGVGEGTRVEIDLSQEDG